MTSGWTPWAGGDCPVTPETFVEVQYRGSADIRKGLRIDWEAPAGRLAWHHDGADDDIVAYRVWRAV